MNINIVRINRFRVQVHSDLIFTFDMNTKDFKLFDVKLHNTKKQETEIEATSNAMTAPTKLIDIGLKPGSTVMCLGDTKSNEKRGIVF